MLYYLLKIVGVFQSDIKKNKKLDVYDREYKMYHFFRLKEAKENKVYITRNVSGNQIVIWVNYDGK